MITAKYDEKNLHLQVTGHAGAGEYGHDLVCAAVSILMRSLQAQAEGLADHHDMLRLNKCSVEQGEADIHLRPVHGFDATARLVMTGTVVGLKILAHDFPAYITLEEK